MNWTAAFDDLLTERWKQTCSLCGRLGVHVGIWEVEALFLSFVFCRLHASTMAESEQALDRLLRQRYAIDPRGTADESEPS
jgi:hypothetical protein